LKYLNSRDIELILGNGLQTQLPELTKLGYCKSINTSRPSGGFYMGLKMRLLRLPLPKQLTNGQIADGPGHETDLNAIASNVNAQCREKWRKQRHYILMHWFLSVLAFLQCQYY